MFEFISIVCVIAIATITCQIATEKGRNGALWMIYGLLLGPLALLHSLLLNPNGNAVGYTTCKECCSVVSNKANKCMHCGSDVAK